MGLVLIAKLPLEGLGPAVVDVEIDKINVIAPFFLKPVHDGRQSLAGRSPEGEELDQGWIAIGQIYRIWIRRMERG